MKKRYEAAELELIKFDVEDIVTASEPGSIPDEDTPSGDYTPGGWT